MKNIFLKTTLVATFVATIIHAGHAQRVNRQALKAYELGSFAEAAEAYEKIVRKAGTTPEDAARYAESLRMLGRLDEAAAVYNEIGDIDNPDIAYRHALTLSELGRYPQAVERLSLAAKMKHPGAAQLSKRIAYAQTHRGDPTSWKVSNEFVNTTGDDFGAETVGPVVVFASARAEDRLQLYRSVRDGNNFLRVPNRLHRVSGEANAEVPLAYSRSDDLIAYTRNNFTPGERFLPEAGWELSLLLTTPTEDGDFLPGKAFAHNGTGYSTGFPSFSPDGTRLYFASDRPGGEGGYDLYYSERQNDGWGAPVNLGPTVNSPGNEISPHGSTGALYFASDYLPGYGGMDIYRADQLGDKFTNVVNLGEGVNSTLDDFGFVLTDDGNFGYFSSNRAGGKGGLDLYRAVRAGTAVTFAVVDGKTRQPVPNAILDFSDCGQGIFLTGVDGSYTFRALSNLDCRPFVRKSGFNAKQFSFVAKGIKDPQRIELVLNPEDKISVYEGRLVDSRSGDAVSGVRVFARHKSSDFTAEAVSDASGRYTLGLQRASDYVIEYLASGYGRINRELSTYESDGAGALSTFALFPDGSSSGPIASSTRAVNPDSVPAEATQRTDATVTDAGNSSAVPTGESSRRVAGEVTPGFAVQVAAVKMSPGEIERYQRQLSGVGQAYGRLEGDIMKVRVGPFDSRESAAPTLARVRDAGFTDAFVAAEVGGKVVGLDRVESLVAPSTSSTISPMPKPATTKSTPTPAPAQPEPNVPVTTRTSISWEEPTPAGAESTPPKEEIAAVNSPGAFLIRLATYSSLANFDQAKASALGTLTTRRSGEYVVVLLQGFEDAGAAKAQVDAVRRGGFPDAHVVEEQADGVLKIVR